MDAARREKYAKGTDADDDRSRWMMARGGSLAPRAAIAAEKLRGRDYGRIVMLMLKLGRLNGPTFPFTSACLMHSSAGVPTAGPETEMVCTRPSDPKVMLAREGASCPFTHALAARLFDCSALAIAPCDGVSGTPAVGAVTGAAAAAAGAAAAGAAAACFAVAGAAGASPPPAF
jgi:hypothetical protein